ncbi:uncharacterized protein LOC143531883 [Bidens hawaiensis]|uniref:uncharacterized protein LOC143531883 n=1 Tax=Bidens hawaiensis TaxID=980011 RepID=UPI00404AB3C8
MGSSVNLESKELKDCAAESDRKPPLVSVKKNSKRKTEVKLPEIIDIDDDDVDDDQGKRASNKIKRDYNKKEDDDGDDGEFISSIKRSRVSKEMKKEHLDTSAKKSPLLEKDELDGSEPDSGSDIEQVQKLYAFSIAKLTKRKEGWKSESDMVKDFEKDDELCLNGVCALHRQKSDVNRSDTLRLNSLARKLIDGDSQKKLKKKASDLNRLDLDHYRTFAKRYSSRLFNIYLNKSDPFFPTSRSQE